MSESFVQVWLRHGFIVDAFKLLKRKGRDLFFLRPMDIAENFWGIDLFWEEEEKKKKCCTPGMRKSDGSCDRREGSWFFYYFLRKRKTGLRNSMILFLNQSWFINRNVVGSRVTWKIYNPKELKRECSINPRRLDRDHRLRTFRVKHRWLLLLINGVSSSEESLLFDDGGPKNFKGPLGAFV